MNQINKDSTAAQVISLCARRKTRLHTDRKGGFTEIISLHPQRRSQSDEQTTPPTAA